MDEEKLLPPLTADEMFPRKIPCHRKVSRVKMIGVLFVSALTIVFITIACIPSESKCSIPSTLYWTMNMKQRPPQCIIIGVRKAGTGALRHFLQIHPGIKMTKQEPNFFSYKYSNGFSWYLSQMPFTTPDQMTVEKSSNNFHHNKAPQRTYMFNNTIKLIVVVRDPVARAVSDYTQRVVNFKLPRNFESAAVDPDTGLVNKDYTCLKPSFYYKHMKRWLKYFSMKQIHVVDGENFIKNPYEEMHSIETFLGLPHKLTKETFVYNETKGFYCYKADTNQDEMQCLNENKGRTHIPVEEEVLDKLREYFQPENEKFFAQIHKKFDWSRS